LWTASRKRGIPTKDQLTERITLHNLTLRWMVLAGNKKYIALAALSLAVCAAANGAVQLGIDLLEQSDYAILRDKRIGLIIVASWRSNVASFRSERAPYLIY
jgi:hypothetical protein